MHEHIKLACNPICALGKAMAATSNGDDTPLDHPNCRLFSESLVRSWSQDERAEWQREREALGLPSDLDDPDFYM